ncbi:MAG: excinuclease ABC subunit UvrA [Kiritimatiellia bacterium]
MKAQDAIVVTGARAHNLKNISVTIPRNRLTVVTGVSGSGKSSLAFDTLFAEGQRRYLESLPAYARQFLDQMDKPDVDSVTGLSPAISIEQHSSTPGPRSILATATELHDYLRLLFSTLGVPHCHRCGKRVEATSAETIVEKLLDSPDGARLTILAPLKRRASPAPIAACVDAAAKAGFVRLRVDGEILPLEDVAADAAAATLEAVVDRLVVKPDARRRVTDSVELALAQGGGSAIVLRARPGEDEVEEHYSERNECTDCGISFDVLASASFSFNNYRGACPVCEGLGREACFDEALVVPDDSLSLAQGAIRPWRRGPKRLVGAFNMMLRSVAAWQGVDMDTPWRDLPESVRHIVLHGSGDEELVITKKVRGNVRRSKQVYEGVLPNLRRRLRESESESMVAVLRTFMSRRRCSACGGRRLKPEILACRIPHPAAPGVNIADLLALSVADLRGWVRTLPLTATQRAIAGNVVNGLKSRLDFLVNVGLGYLTGDRESATLSGGEMQRIRLASQVGAGLSGVLYVLDEPTIGLHPHDNAQLVAMLRRLQARGNTLVVVEHDEMMIREADHLVDIGPGAGVHGGRVMFEGSFDDLLKSRDSLTARFLNGVEKPCIPERREPDGRWLAVKGASIHNLRDVDASFPLGCLTVVTGVSGSGKSSLVDDVLRANLQAYLAKPRRERAGFAFQDCAGIVGAEAVDKLIVIDKTPIGRSPRSNPLTYTGAFDTIRNLFAATPAAKARGYTASRFSFNVKGGRCEVCKGDGRIHLAMSFLPDVYVTCEQCAGRRYNKETLEVHYGGRSIADVLALTVAEAVEAFANVPRLARKLQTLEDVGLGYLQLGQPVSTLSGGEAQRLQLSAELQRPPEEHTVYLLDEPTTGLHFADVRRLLQILVRFRDAGHTVVVIEHNPDVMRAADWIIDMGPGGGAAGGTVVAFGPPETIAKHKSSLTAAYL